MTYDAKKMNTSVPRGKKLQTVGVKKRKSIKYKQAGWEIICFPHGVQKKKQYTF